jgi:hypothetical protein
LPAINVFPYSMISFNIVLLLILGLAFTEVYLARLARDEATDTGVTEATTSVGDALRVISESKNAGTRRFDVIGGRHQTARLLSNGNLSNPLLAFKSKSTGHELCYETLESRRQPLNGSFENIGYRVARYWNLSCPIELSKHSCAHQGMNASHADYAANLHFVPLDCELLTREEMLPYLALHQNLSIVFVGNSLMRQILTSLICEMHAMGLTSSIQVEWRSCASKHRWPCHGTFHCIQCGEHSGTFGYSAYFHGGGSVRFVPTENMAGLAADRSRIDLMIGQRLDDGTDKAGMDTYFEFRKRNSLPVPKFISFSSYGAHFVSGGDLFDADPSGVYNETFLVLLHESGGTVPCLRSAGADQTWYDAGHAVYKKWLPEGFLWLQGTNTLGEAKIGNSVGKFGDCQHFCQPGPTDEIARGLLQLILAVFTFPASIN